MGSTKESSPSHPLFQLVTKAPNKPPETRLAQRLQGMLFCEGKIFSGWLPEETFFFFGGSFFCLYKDGVLYCRSVFVIIEERWGWCCFNDYFYDTKPKLHARFFFGNRELPQKSSAAAFLASILESPPHDFPWKKGGGPSPGRVKWAKTKKPGRILSMSHPGCLMTGYL